MKSLPIHGKANLAFLVLINIFLMRKKCNLLTECWTELQNVMLLYCAFRWTRADVKRWRKPVEWRNHDIGYYFTSVSTSLENPLCIYTNMSREFVALKHSITSWHLQHWVELPTEWCSPVVRVYARANDTETTMRWIPHTTAKSLMTNPVLE